MLTCPPHCIIILSFGASDRSLLILFDAKKQTNKNKNKSVLLSVGMPLLIIFCLKQLSSDHNISCNTGSVWFYQVCMTAFCGFHPGKWEPCLPWDLIFSLESLWLWLQKALKSVSVDIWSRWYRSAWLCELIFKTRANWKWNRSEKMYSPARRKTGN